MESTSDFLLVHRARAGDEEACERLVRKYYPSIYQYCLLHIYDTYEAEDLTQEVFCQSLCKLRSIQGIWQSKKLSVHNRRKCSEKLL